MLRAWVKAAQIAAVSLVAVSAGSDVLQAQDEELPLSSELAPYASTLPRNDPAPGNAGGPSYPSPPDLGAPTFSPKPSASGVNSFSGTGPIAPAVPSGAPTAASDIASRAGQHRQFPNFYELRASVLDLIGAATTRIWLVTDYLTDGETVSALYIAQYRKIEVKVLLGRGRANHYMSRLNYLKNQNIPVYLKPDNFKIPGGGATAIITDSTLVTVDGELDFLAKYKKFNLAYGTAAETQAAMAAFAEALNAKVPAIAHQLPLVGKHNPRGTAFAPPPPNFSGTDTGGAYKYDRNSSKRPHGFPEKLPKTPKWQHNSSDSTTN